ncbi:MAG: hypothetical protein Hyperionvirus2_7 [Hyperionvirus sp.]|uniref:Uncharacterized protein n=1 Tax=Hyperionvirus sp. TaxID=2487770 RepID=A0A3G5ABE4_9VIRU|nr:MAG: hypothetical protein Hyperionvirus2_7 [Hyperionvirus sp.]
MSSMNASILLTNLNTLQSNRRRVGVVSLAIDVRRERRVGESLKSKQRSGFVLLRLSMRNTLRDV